MGRIDRLARTLGSRSSLVGSATPGVADGYPAPVLGGDVGEGLGERSLVAYEVLGGVLPFAVLEVGWLQDDACAVLTRPVALGPHVGHAHRHRVRDLARAGRGAIAADIADDQGAVTELELSAVVVPDPYALYEPEGRTEPGDGVAPGRWSPFVRGW